MSDRRTAIKSIAASTAGIFSLSEVFAANEKALGPKLNGKINHSVCKWCYSKIPLETFAQECKNMGISSVELLGPDEWPILKKYGLTCALPNGAGMGIEKGFNDLALHDELVKSYEDIFPKLKDAGYSTVICFSGNRRGMSEIGRAHV